MSWAAAAALLRPSSMLSSSFNTGGPPSFSLGLCPIIEEPLEADVGQGVIGQLLEHVVRQCGNVCSGNGGVHDVVGVAHGGHEDFGLEAVIREDRLDRADDLHPVLGDVVEAPDERRYDGGA